MEVSHTFHRSNLDLHATSVLDKGNFTKDSIKTFDSMCRPSCQEVYGVMPEPGQRVSTFSSAYPVSLVTRMASGSVSAKQGARGQISVEARLRSLRELELPTADIPFSCQVEERLRKVF